ncbi:MAG: hypothetical protein P8J33_09630, partial [Pirellulaceae bacterium]|nr:hypothetical protein [Pirellulaceae bacterium]
MFDSITKCLQSTRFPVLCLVLIMVMNGLAAWSVPPLAPVLIGFDKEAIQVREGDTHNLSVELDPLPTADVQVVLEWDGPEHETCWQFGQHRDLAIAGDGRWVLRIPEGRRTLTLPIRFIDDEIKKTQPDVLKINLLHLTENTKPGGFNETRIEIKDAYIAPVIEIAPDAALQVREGNVLTLPVIAHGEVDLPISVPFALRDSAKDIKGEPANAISFREGSNLGTIDLKAVKDRLYEGEEKFSLRLEEGEQYVLGDRREIEFTVIDGDSPPVYQIDATQSVFGHDEPVRLRLRANIPSSEETRIDYTLEPDSVLPVDILPPDKRVGQFIVPAGKEDVLHA